MRRVVLPRLPHLMQQVRAGAFCRSVQVVLQAPIFFPRRCHQSPQLRFQKRLVSRACAQQHDQRHSALRKFRVVRGARSLRASTLPRRLLCLLLAHGGGDCTPTAPFRKQYGVRLALSKAEGQPSCRFLVALKLKLQSLPVTRTFCLFPVFLCVLCASVANPVFLFSSPRLSGPHSSCRNSSPHSAPENTSRASPRDTPG